jgi:hypothetical protein
MALPPYQIHENLHSSSKVISGGHMERERERKTDRQTGDLISLLSFLENRIKSRYNSENYWRLVRSV